MKKFLSIINIILISICAFMLSACTENYDKFSLHFSSQSIELTLNQEEEFDIEIENYFKTDIDFNFDLDKQIIKIDDSVEDLGSGRFRIKVTALSSGKATLTITLLQGNKTLMVPVNVYEPVSGFALKTNLSLFVIRGQSLTFDSEMFNFYPENTLETDLTFSAYNEILENNTFVSDDLTENEVTITATSVSNSNLSYSFEIRVLEAIDTSNTFLSLNDKVVPTINEDESSYISLISNNTDNYKKTLTLTYDTNENYKYELFSKSKHTSIETQKRVEFENMLFADIQATDFAGEDDILVVRISYADFDAYTVDLEYKVKIEAMPKQVKINGQKDIQVVDLFDNNLEENKQSVIVSVEPALAKYETVKAEFYIEKTNEATLEKSRQLVDYVTIRQYICVKYKEIEIENEQIFDDLTAQIEFYGRRCLPENIGEMIYIRFVCESKLLDEPIYNEIPVKIRKSATNFYIDSTKYQDSTLYVQKGDEVVFNDFVVVEQDAYIGKITAINNSHNNVCSVSQTEINKAEILVSAMSVGETSYTLIMSSGISTRIKIVVLEQLDLDNLWLYIKSSNVENVAEVQYKQVNGNDTLNFVALRGIGEFEVSANMPKTIDARMFTLTYESADNSDVTVDGNKIKALTSDNTRHTITAKLSTKKIENFMIVDDIVDNTDFSFEVLSFSPISVFSFTGVNAGYLNSQYSKDVDVYDYSMLGYVDRPLSEISFKLMIDGEEKLPNDPSIQKMEWEFSVSYEYDSELNAYRLTESGDITYGYFYLDELKFECNLSGLNITGGFSITAKIYEYGKIISSTVDINVKKYVQVDAVWFYNYVDSIYLDSINTETTIYPYILPTNATNKNFVVWFEPIGDTSSSIVQLNYNANSINIKYSGTGGGTGKICIVPTSKYNSSDPNDYSYIKEINISIGDGSINSPIHIGTFEQFKNIDLSKHYVIDTIIDAGGESIAPFGQLTGGIKGYVKENGNVSNVGGIVNFKVTSPKTITVDEGNVDAYGLFTTISEGAYIINLTLRGSIDVQDTNKISYIGLVAGENNGLIKNVNVTLTQSKVTANGLYKTYVGGIVGKNNSIIVNDVNTTVVGQNIANIDTEKDIDVNKFDDTETDADGYINEHFDSYPTSSTLFVFMNQGDLFELKLEGGNPIYYFGGAVGYNNGLIKFRNESLKGRYNYYGTSVNVYMAVKNDQGGTSNIGSIAGYNENGNIVNMVASGRITAQSENNVGGIVGYNKNGKILANQTRVFVRGQNNVAGLIGFAEGGTIDNNIVEAIDDRTSTGLKASMIVASDNNLSEILNSRATLGTNNQSISYITRTFNGKKEVSDKELSDINSYYGEVVKVVNGSEYNGQQFTNNGTDTSLETLYNSTGYPDYSIVLSYYKAKDINNQRYLNEFNKLFLPTDLFTGKVEINIESKANTIISVSSFGELTLHNTGVAVLTLTSALNKDNKIDITVYVTNYVSDLGLYSTPDRQTPITSDNIIKLSNRNTINIYPQFIAQVKKGNTIIDLVENQDFMLEIEGNDYVTVSQSGKVITLRGNGTTSSTENQSIGFYAYLSVAGQKRYIQIQDDESLVIKTDKSLIKQLQMSYSQGIYSIELDKANITCIPSDTIKVRVTYLTDDVTDSLGLVLNYVNGGDFVDYFDETQKETFKSYFNVEISDPTKVDGFENKYYVDFVFEMNISNIRIGNFQFIFSGSMGAVQKIFDVRYVDQPINNVIIKNYSFKDNEDILYAESEDQPGVYIYNTSYTLNETNIATAGEPNVLKITVMPDFADYSYIEVTNHASNIENGNVVLFGLLKPNAGNLNQGLLSSEAYYVANGIRAMKSAVYSGELNIIYRLATNVFEGDSIILNINFYNDDGEIVYEQQQKVLVININKTVSVSIAGKAITDGCYVARGYTYLLDVKTVGYNPKDIVIESLSSYAKVINDNGTYYLKIADDVSYTKGNEGAPIAISYYGRHLVDGVMVNDTRHSFNCTIVEYVIDDINNVNNMFSDDELFINVSNTKDIRDLILDKFEIEYSSNAVGAVNELKASLKNKAYYFYKVLDTFNQINSDSNVSEDLFDIKGFAITPKKVGEKLLQLGIYANLQYFEGYIQVLEDVEVGDINDADIKAFDVTVNQNTSKEHPLPINTIEDLQKMSEGNYYILMNDITIPSGFTPINVPIASFDGNGKKFIFSGVYEEYTALENFGLFETIPEQTIIQNVTISIEGSITTTFTFRNEASTSSFNFGLLAAENNGVVTNCKVVSQNASSSIVVTNSAPLDATDTSYIACLVAVNNGYITNSQVSTKIESYGANLSGFVAENNGHISSCCVKQSLIKNSSTNVNNSTGGFVVVNNKTILASYVEGSYGDGLKPMYANSSLYIIRATSIAGAFAYINAGDISDCYANIPVESSSLNSGFVCTNTGNIKNSYTTSKLGDRDTGNYPFFINQPKDEDGKYKNTITGCYYLKDNNFNVNINQSNETYGKGLRPTTLLEFASGLEVVNNKFTDTKLFKEFVINKDNDINKGIWFIASDNNSFINSNLINKGQSLSMTDYRKYIQYVREIECNGYMYKGKPASFVENRPQLVSANLIAFSSKKIAGQEYIEETGETKYTYVIDSEFASEGTIQNPYIIYSAKQFEDNFVKNSVRNINNEHYRFVKDIDYIKEELITSSLYSYIVAGYIEGNGMTISNFSINTNESLLSGGYFAQVGNGNNYATIQNLVFKPRYINLPNAINVGVVAGSLSKAYAYNIAVDGYGVTNTGIVVLGKNIVGGVFGRTLSAFDINKISSSISTNAYYTNTNSNWEDEDVQNKILYNEGESNNNTVSYSGAVIGYVGGTGIVKNTQITNKVAVIGMVGGFMFGGIGINATVKDIEFTPLIDSKNYIRASAYGGLIVGDLRGSIINANVYSAGQKAMLFNMQPNVSLAVGGIAGIGRGVILADGDVGNIKDCNVYQELTFATSTLAPKSVGGLVGKVVRNIKIENCNYLGTNIEARQSVGGLIGELYIGNLESSSKVNIIGCNVGTVTTKNVEVVSAINETTVETTDETTGDTTGETTGDGDTTTEPTTEPKVEGQVILKIVKPAKDEDTLSMYAGGIVGYLYGEIEGTGTTDTSGDTDTSSDKKTTGDKDTTGESTDYPKALMFTNVTTNVKITSDISIYGSLTTGDSTPVIGTYTKVWAAGLVGGYDANINNSVKSVLSIQGTNDIDVIFDLTVKNLRNGDKNNGLQDTTIYVAWYLYGGYSNDENENSVEPGVYEGEIKINNTSYNIGDGTIKKSNLAYIQVDNGTQKIQQPAS